MIYEKEWDNPNYIFLSYDADNLNWYTHFHESFEICHVIEGQINITIESVSYTLKKGGTVIIFPRQLHSYKTETISKIRIVTFLPKLVPEFSDIYKNMIPERNSIENAALFLKYCDPKNIIAQKGLAYSVLGLFAESAKFRTASPNEESQILIKLLKYIEKNYKHECSLHSAASELSYGYSYLSRTFKKRMGLSYTEYLNKYRINRALYLLSNAKHFQIQEIAEQCGYDSICSFNRNFKHFTGKTPRETLKGDRK